MIDRRIFLSASAATALLPARLGAEDSSNDEAPDQRGYRVRSSDLGMAALYVEDMKPGDSCRIANGKVYWRGRVMGMVPDALAGSNRCRVFSAGVDEQGKTVLMVRDFG